MPDAPEFDNPADIEMDRKPKGIDALFQAITPEQVKELWDMIDKASELQLRSALRYVASFQNRYDHDATVRLLASLSQGDLCKRGCTCFYCEEDKRKERADNPTSRHAPDE